MKIDVRSILKSMASKFSRGNHSEGSLYAMSNPVVILSNAKGPEMEVTSNEQMHENVNACDVVEHANNEQTQEPIQENQLVRSSATVKASDIETIRVATDVTNDYGVFLGISMRGKSHIESNTGCQDYHMYEQIEEGWHLLILSDGAGSAKYAERGSKGNCTIASALFKKMISSNQWVEKNYFPTELQWYIECRSIFEQMKLVYRSKATEANDRTEETDFNATIIVCLLTPLGMLVAHIGDGRMGYLTKDDEWKSLMTPHKGEEANQTLFLQNSWTYPHVPALTISGVCVPETHVVREIPKAVALISDGCERATWQCSIFNEQTGKYEDVNKPHPQFMNPLIESIINEPTSNRFQLFSDIIEKGTPSCEQERDDKTMLLAINRNYYDLSNNQAGQND